MKILRIFAIIYSIVATQAASKQHGDGGSGKQAFPRHRSFKSTFLLTLPEEQLMPGKMPAMVFFGGE